MNSSKLTSWFDASPARQEAIISRSKHHSFFWQTSRHDKPIPLQRLGQSQQSNVKVVDPSLGQVFWVDVGCLDLYELYVAVVRCGVVSIGAPCPDCVMADVAPFPLQLPAVPALTRERKPLNLKTISQRVYLSHLKLGSALTF